MSRSLDYEIRRRLRHYLASGEPPVAFYEWFMDATNGITAPLLEAHLDLIGAIDSAWAEYTDHAIDETELRAHWAEALQTQVRRDRSPAA